MPACIDNSVQYVTFNALSIAYVWIIQRRIGRLANVQSRYREYDLFELAETVQSHLATITQKNAPNLRYSLILGELQLEAKRAVSSPSSGDPGTSSSSGGQGSASVHSVPTGQMAGSSDWELNSVDFPLDPNLWLQLDAFPFSRSSSKLAKASYADLLLADNYFHDGSGS